VIENVVDQNFSCDADRGEFAQIIAAIAPNAKRIPPAVSVRRKSRNGERSRGMGGSARRAWRVTRSP
jgi:hypothetical protein